VFRCRSFQFRKHSGQEPGCQARKWQVAGVKISAIQHTLNSEFKFMNARRNCRLIVLPPRACPAALSALLLPLAVIFLPVYLTHARSLRARNCSYEGHVHLWLIMSNSELLESCGGSRHTIDVCSPYCRAYYTCLPYSTGLLPTSLCSTPG
jgi:hypothetical protein